MKVLLASYSDCRGGAARATYRLYQGLQQVGVDVTLKVQTKHSGDPSIVGPSTKLEKGLSVLRPTLDSLPLSWYPQRNSSIYSLNWFPERFKNKLAQIKPDIINLHWINAGYLQIETLAKLNYPIVWTLHDMWPFTGGCHYTQGCEGYRQSCGACPQLASKRQWDLSRWVWWRKTKAWRNLNLTLVTPSRWLAKCAAESSLFQNRPIQVIPNGLDLEQYRPISRQLAKNLLGLSPDKFTLLFAALSTTSDPRKGYHLLLESLSKLKLLLADEAIELVIMGASSVDNFADLGYKIHAFGQLHDEISLVLTYSAADLLVAPSIEDNLPNTVIEALACGTPCVAFDIGGMPDIIEHQQNGFLVQPFDKDELAYGIAWVLQEKERYESLRDRARQKTEEMFDLKIQTNAYLSLFKRILKDN